MFNKFSSENKDFEPPKSTKNKVLSKVAAQHIFN